MLVSVIVPAYNESSTIRSVLERVHEVPLAKEVIVVDDGSTDGTSDAARCAMTGMKGVSLLRLSKNRGKGRAIREALGHVRGGIVIIQDADNEYDPADYPRLVEPIVNGEAEVVYGSRNLDPNPKSYSRYYWGGRFLTFLINIMYGSHLTDEATCYKVFRTSVLKQIKLTRNGFGFCPEVTCKLLRKRYSIREIPIRYVPRSMEEGKKIRWWHGIEAMVIIFMSRLMRMR